MADEKEIFEGKTFQDLTKDIYENTTKNCLISIINKVQ